MKFYPLICILATFTNHLPAAESKDLPLEDFNASDYGAWTKTGTAFDSGPASGEMLARLEITNAPDSSVASSEILGDPPQGTLTSPLFTIERDFIAYHLGGGDYEIHNCLDLLVDGKVVRSATGRNSDQMTSASWDVRDFRGKEAQIRIVDAASGDWGHINVDKIVQTDSPANFPVTTEPLYQEKLRPQFHFTARQWTMDRLNPGMRQEGWINDLNGLIYYEGEYHMFAQRWAKCWLHAVSKDLIHWTELEPAFWEESLGSGVQSGYTVIDYHNTSGLSPDPKNPPMVAFWSRFDNRSQCISYSLDKGRSWKHYEKNPIFDFPERDPKVFWYEPGKHWVMLMYGSGQYHFFTSQNLLDWKDEKNPVPNCFECPDFFELPVDGDPKKKKWLLVHGDGKYCIGRFDGTKFTEESERFFGDLNIPNFYATQSWHNTETGDGRRIQVAWMRGSNFPNMPFSQQISFPCELTLRTTPGGLRLFREPIQEVELLQKSEQLISEQILAADEVVELTSSGDLFRIEAQVEIPQGAELHFNLRGVPLVLTHKSVQSGEPKGDVQEKIHSVEILLDRGSLEAFVNDGELSLTRFVLPEGKGVSAGAVGGPVTIHSIKVHELKSAWNVGQSKE